MDVQNDEVPQLDVKTEIVERRLSTLSNDETEKHFKEEFSTPQVSKPFVPNVPSTEEADNLGLSKDPNVKCSEPEFGSMENVSLDISIQDKASIMQGVLLENSDDVSAQVSDSSNDLSKYFNSESVNKEVKDPDGINFFNALAENPPKNDQDIFLCVQQKSAEKQHINANEEKTQPEPFSMVSKEKANKGDNPPPTLLKFFSEDKSGKDKDGKAFFDKIADDKITGALEINEPILNIPATDCFLNSPASSSEIEDAWIPLERTRLILVSIITATTPFTPDKSDLTMPGIIIEEEMEDPIKALLIECNSTFAQQRNVLTANDVSEDEMGLKKLMENQCYHAAINLTKRLLISCGQGPGNDGKPTSHTPLSLRLWYTRLALFIKLRKFSLAEVESAAFGLLDKPDLYYEFYPDIYKGKKGTMVPFAFRLLLAELPQYQGNHKAALDNMYRILSVIQKMINNVENGYAEDGSMIELPDSRKTTSLELWRKREKTVLFSILNCVLAQKDYILAVSIAKNLIQKSGSDTAQLHSALGRIYLQLGDVHCAENCFKTASLVAKKISKDFSVEENVNNALLAVACDENEKAFKYFEQAYSIQPNAMLINNMAVCKLYTGQLKESLRLLESAIKQSPSYYLHDGLLFNVCTLYELESSRCPQKKLAMLELVSQHAGDAFNVSCLKIQTAKA